MQRELLRLAQHTRCRIWRQRNQGRDFFPEGTEALLTGFSEHIPLKLPQGYGFRVEALGGDVPDNSRHWLAIIRTFCGDTELFAIMA